MKKKARKFAENNMFPKFNAEDLFKAVIEEGKILEEKRVQENIDMIDKLFMDLAFSVVGRDLTDDEQSAILDIVDEYTPKDKNGNYLCSLLPFDYAWEIYRIKIARNPAGDNYNNATSSLQT